MTRRPPTVIEKTDGSRTYVAVDLKTASRKLRTAKTNGTQATFDSRKVPPNKVEAIRQGDRRLTRTDLFREESNTQENPCR